MRPGNLMRPTVSPIRCMVCYDFGEIIDRFDHSKRRPCECGVAKEPVQQIVGLTPEQVERIFDRRILRN
jgi:hypothetical protein